MAILRIERAVYGVDDLATCTRFFEDFGLSQREQSPDVVKLATQTGALVELRLASDPTLAPSLESGPTLREIVWGVDDQAGFDRLVDNLRRDREVRMDDEGVAHTRDETGFGLGFTIAKPEIPQSQGQLANCYGADSRWNQPLTLPPQIRPLRICHVAWNIPKQRREAAVALYTERLGFRITDDVRPMGTFMQAEGDRDQHTILLCHRPDRAGINHTSYEVHNADEVILGGNQMIERGWREARRLGRHTVGSNIFRFVHAPCGGRVEYAADMDRVNDEYETRVHETTPPHHIWVLETNRDGEQS